MAQQLARLLEEIPEVQITQKVQTITDDHAPRGMFDQFWHQFR
jgi:hypothetical protein